METFQTVLEKKATSYEREKEIFNRCNAWLLMPTFILRDPTLILAQIGLHMEQNLWQVGDRPFCEHEKLYGRNQDHNLFWQLAPFKQPVASFSVDGLSFYFVMGAQQEVD